MTSGIRIGTPALTTRGMGDAEMQVLGQCIANALKHRDDPAAMAKVGQRDRRTSRRFSTIFERIDHREEFFIMSEVKAGLGYSEEHEWAEARGTLVRIGITDFAQSQLGDIVFVEAA